MSVLRGEGTQPLHAAAARNPFCMPLEDCRATTMFMAMCVREDVEKSHPTKEMGNHIFV